MPLTIEPLHPTFTAEIRGVDFSKPLTEDVFQEIQAAITKVCINDFFKAIPACC